MPGDDVCRTAFHCTLRLSSASPPSTWVRYRIGSSTPHAIELVEIHLPERCCLGTGVDVCVCEECARAQVDGSKTGVGPLGGWGGGPGVRKS